MEQIIIFNIFKDKKDGNKINDKIWKIDEEFLEYINLEINLITI